MDKDLRYKILNHFKDVSTAERMANDFLATLKTYNDTDDLGTIRRALEELIDSDLLMMSNHNKKEALHWFIQHMNTDTSKSLLSDQEIKYKKSSKRLIHKVGNYDKIPPIKIYTSIHGVKFLKEYRRFKNENWWKAFFLVLGALLGYFISNIGEETKVESLQNNSQVEQVDCDKYHHH